MHVSQIQIRDEHKKLTDCAQAALIAGRGLAGDAVSGREDRQLSLLAGELLPGLRELDGLCTRKFQPNLVTQGVDYAALHPGVTLRIGQARIEITAQGKRCFDECPFRQRGERCPLPNNCAFGRVLAGGDIAVGDVITIETA